MSSRRISGATARQGRPSQPSLAKRVKAVAPKQEHGVRIADARVLTRRVGLHPVRLIPLGQLLQNLLKHLGRVVLTAAFAGGHFVGH